MEGPVFELVPVLDDSINIDTRTSYGLGVLIQTFTCNWSGVARALAEPVLAALPLLKNGRQVDDTRHRIGPEHHLIAQEMPNGPWPWIPLLDASRLPPSSSF